ncbi:MAG: hypothetical protein E6Q06_01100 [Candidatus Moraniibacteriota bacterium]|nr:MAG: hypothetical protein E6Q06_01100 [Candidatus Moranbacteria bacterium]
MSFGSIQRQGMYFWIRHYKFLFLIVFIAVTAFVGNQWHRDLYRYQWTAEERKAYLESTANETAFQEQKFLKALEHLERDREAHSEIPDNMRDIFAGARKKQP